MLQIGRTLQGGKYRIEKVLGQGGFGITYRAIWVMATKPYLREKVVAIKEYFPRQIVLRDTLSGEILIPGESDQHAFEHGLKQFIAEGDLLHGAKYGGVVTVHDIFEENGTAYLVMEFLAGQSLAAELRAAGGKGLPEERVRTVMQQVVEALEALHTRHIFHLDIKPANIMCAEDGEVVLIDFGAAKQGTNLVTQSLVAFSPGYAPPEMLGRGGFSAQTDIFELGMMLHELLTGYLPPSAIERLAGEDWQPDSLPEPWRAMIAEATTLKRDRRPENAREWWNRSASRFEHLEAPSVNALRVGGTPTGKLPVPESDTGSGDSQGSSQGSSQGNSRGRGDSTGRRLLPEGPRTRVNPRDGAEMVWIPPGEFIMGSEDSDPEGRVNERPQRLVYLDGYWIYKYPVTVGQYERFVEAMREAKIRGPENNLWEMPPAPPFNPFWRDKDHPIVNVSWFEAVAYSQWAGTGLPTEAQWEKAARGLDGRPFPWGDAYREGSVWSSVEVRRNATASVLRLEYRSEEPFGVVDMVGNIWEWCSDWYDPEFYRTAPFRNPECEQAPTDWRVLRGGSWADHNPRQFRAAFRAWDYPEYGYIYRGFRCRE